MATFFGYHYSSAKRILSRCRRPDGAYGKGTVGILAHHAPLFSALTEGELKITAGNKEYFLAVGGGFMEVGKKALWCWCRAHTTQTS